MAKVRNRTLLKTDYKGRETDAFDAACPCRSCWHPHDCGRMVPRYDKLGNCRHEWQTDMQCATRYNGGCPRPMPEPKHIRPTARTRKCKRCGAWRPKGVAA